MSDGPSPRRLSRTAHVDPIATVRERVAHAIDGASLRAVAREVGVSPSGLQRFADGGNPYRSTRRKLVEWYTRHEAAAELRELSPEAAGAALELLVHELPRRRRVDARLRIVDVIRAAYVRSGMEPPAWLDTLA